jgi:hypothetical protein
LDENGWADIGELIAKAAQKGKNFSREELEEVVEMALALLQGKDSRKAYRSICKEPKDWLMGMGGAVQLETDRHFSRLLSGEIARYSSTDIRSSGYVVHTLEAAIWCLLTTDNYRDVVLKAVNMGEDTDTTAAVTGGLAGLIYGKGAIPADWLASLVRKDDIEDLGERLMNKTNEQWQKHT